jgi:ABC-type Mn2+/Zn2+ transport system permease subunit
MNVKTYILIGMVISIILIWIFYRKPKINSFDYSITFPWRIQDYQLCMD